MWMAGLAQKPELVVQKGHSMPIWTVSFSPDGKTLASGGVDQTIKLWDTTTGRQLRTLVATSSVLSIVFSPDGNLIASGYSGDTIGLWDVATGDLRRTFTGHSEAIISVAFSPDGQTLASGSADLSIKLWDVATGQERRTLTGHSERISAVAFSPDGRTLASASRDSTIRLWDVATGRAERTLDGGAQEFSSVTFAVDGTLVSGSDKIIVWDLATGQPRRTLSGHSYWVETVACSKDGKLLVSVSMDAIKIWDINTGRELQTLTAPDIFNSIALSADGKVVASAGMDHAVRLWAVTTGQQLLTLSGKAEVVNSVHISPDGKALVSQSRDEWNLSGTGTQTSRLWDVASGRNPQRRESFLDFSPDSKALAIKIQDKTIKLSNASTGEVVRTFAGPLEVGSFAALSPNGKTLVSLRDKEIQLWDVATGQQLRTIVTGHFLGIHSVAFSPDSKLLASGSFTRFSVSPGESTVVIYDDPKDIPPGPLEGSAKASTAQDATLQLWDVSTGQLLRALTPRTESASVLSFAPDGGMLASADDKTIKLWNLPAGREMRALRGHVGSVLALAFAPNGRTLASASTDRTIKLWDVTTGRELLTLSGHYMSVNSVAFSLNGKILISGSQDTTMKLWDVVTGKELASLLALDEQSWLVITPDGLFDGSPAAWEMMLWRFNNNTFDVLPVESFFNEFYYPGLLTDIFAGKRPKPPTDISQKDRRPPQLELTLVDADSNTTLAARNLALKIDVSHAPAGAQDVRLFRNGSLAKVWHGEVLKGQSIVTLEATIPIIAGVNRLTAYAFNHDNIKSADASLVINGADNLKRQGTAYLLAVGVNNYSNPNYKLKYAVADAEDFAAEIQQQQERLKNYGRVEVIPLYDKDATKANILLTLSQLADKAQPEDAVIVYFSGHGTAQQQRFYLIPHDLGYRGPRTKLSAVDLQTILQHSISDRELEEAFEKIGAGQLLMVIDACNSGQALDSEEKRRGPMNSKGLAQLAYEKGMYLLTAAQSYQAAWEASRLGHGYLTYALVEEGLKKGTADREPKDNTILLREWLDYATERVPQMQEEKMKERPNVRDRRGKKALEFVFVEGDESIKDPAKRSIQRPRVFYRREIEALPLIVARP
jgi:WD40 repeat protein